MNNYVSYNNNTALLIRLSIIISIILSVYYYKSSPKLKADQTIKLLEVTQSRPT